MPTFERTQLMEIRQVNDTAYLYPVSTKDDQILLRRINREPSTYNQPKLRLIPIDGLPNKHVEEALIVRDLLEVLTGFSGMYIRFSWEGVLPNGRVSIPQFRLVKNINLSLKSVCGRLVTLGKHYIVLDCVSELWSDAKYGVVLQSLAFEIRTFLRDVYLNFVSTELEKEYRVNPQCSIKEFGNIVSNSSVSRCMELLYNLYFAIEEEMEFRRTLDRDVAKLKSMLSDIGYRQQTMITKNGDLFGSSNHKSETTMTMMEDLNVRYALLTDGDYFLYAKGGVILNVLHDMINENLGDNVGIDFLRGLLDKISRGYLNMLHTWLSQGELDDPCEEFMISNTMANFSGTIAKPIEFERQWLTQFCIRSDGLLQRFKDHGDDATLFKIIYTGKLLNLVKTSLQLPVLPEETWGDMSDNNISFIDLIEGTNLVLYVDKWYKRANELCLSMLYENFELNKFLTDLQRHFLGYNNGSFFSKMLRRNFTALTKRRTLPPLPPPHGFQTDEDDSSESRLRQYLEREKYFWDDEEDIVMKLLELKFDKQSFRELLLGYDNTSSGIPQTLLNVMKDSNTQHGYTEVRNSIIREIYQEEEEETEEKPASGEGRLNHHGNREMKSNIHYLSFEIAPPYPLSIVVNQINMQQYQLVSRYLHLLRYHSILLDETWYEINKQRVWRRRGYPRGVYYHYHRRIVLRARWTHNKMTQFMKCLLEYFTQDVIGKKVSRLRTQRFATVVELQASLERHLSEIVFSCCLSDLVEFQLQIFDTVQNFCRYVTGLREKLALLQTTTDSADPEGGSSSSSSSSLAGEISRSLGTILVEFEERYTAFFDALAQYTEIRVQEENGERLLRSLPQPSRKGRFFPSE